MRVTTLQYLLLKIQAALTRIFGDAFNPGVPKWMCQNEKGVKPLINGRVLYNNPGRRKLKKN